PLSTTAFYSPSLHDALPIFRLRPRADWHKRNFLTSVLIPSLFIKRAGDQAPRAPQFPKIREGEVCITWIGHASFLVQTHEVNVLDRKSTRLNSSHLGISYAV